MNKILSTIFLLASALTVPAFAQQQAPATPPSAPQAVEATAPEAAPVVLAPFVARYHVFRGDKPLGQATMQLVRTGNRWRVDLSILGTEGLAGAAGLNIQQSTVFEDNAGVYRPISQSTLQRALFSTKQTVGVYDWAKSQARWTGDVKKKRKGQVIALQPGDMSGLLINLAIVRDAKPGAQMSYRFVDDSRLRVHQYAAAPANESITVTELPYDALRVDRTNGGNDRTTVWVATGVPTPIRILMQDNDDLPLDLQLIEYKGK